MISYARAQTLIHEINRILLWDYKLILLKYNINDMRLAVCAMGKWVFQFFSELHILAVYDFPFCPNQGSILSMLCNVFSSMSSVFLCILLCTRFHPVSYKHLLNKVISAYLNTTLFHLLVNSPSLS